MTDERPQVIAQANFLKHQDSLEKMSLRDRFEYIFENNLWSSEESRSGLGSTLLETDTLRTDIPAVLNEIQARSLLDLPCGDFRWMSEVDLGGVSYTGADIVEALVVANTQKFASESRRFLSLDLTSDILPRADVVLCRDCLVHLSYANICRALENVKHSGAKWLLMTNFVRIESNRDIEDGDWRPLNFEHAPFLLPPPHRTIVENCAEAGGAFDDKSLCLWLVADLP
jgi:hypothetical protein